MRAITAINLNNVIGDANNLIWHLPEDLRWFKYYTENEKIVMGANTFKSLGRLNGLPNRENFILSSKHDFEIGEDVKRIGSWSEIIELTDPILIGGAQVYNYALERDLIDSMSITLVQNYDVGDTVISSDFASRLNAVKHLDGVDIDPFMVDDGFGNQRLWGVTTKTKNLVSVTGISYTIFVLERLE